MSSEHKYHSTIYTSVSEIPAAALTLGKTRGTVYFSKAYLSALEQHNPHLSFYYLVVNYEQTPVAFVNLQVVDFYVDALQNDLQKLLESATRLARKIGLLPRNNRLKMLVCGNVFVSGEHGILLAEEQPKKKVLEAIITAIHRFTEQGRFGERIAISLLKDFEEDSLTITKKLVDLKYSSFNVEPNMVLYIQDHWHEFDDYLNTLKTKFRVKARKALQLSQNIRIEEVTADTIEEQLPIMTLLYKSVASKSDFNLGDFNLNTYKELKKQLGEHYILNTFWLNQKLVGFMSGVVYKDTLDAHFVGIDYELNKSHAIYQRMLYEYIRIAIHKKVTSVNFGRTASEIKSSVGATPEHLTIYVRHQKSIANKILKLFLLKIQATPFHQKYPFKKHKTT